MGCACSGEHGAGREPWRDLRDSPHPIPAALISVFSLFILLGLSISLIFILLIFCFSFHGFLPLPL